MINASRWMIYGFREFPHGESDDVEGFKWHDWVRCGSKVQIFARKALFSWRGYSSPFDCGLAALSLYMDALLPNPFAATTKVGEFHFD